MGHSSTKSSAFRKCYGQLGQLRSILNQSTCVVAMTATATTTVRRTIVDSLGMRNYSLIEVSPERHNIKYVVFKTADKNFESVFKWIADEILEKGRSTERMILYCQSRKNVSELHSFFCSLLPKVLYAFFEMYHTNTEGDVQKKIINSFAQEDGEVRILFATIDVRGLHTVILVGHPTELDDLMQLSGRAGRDGTQSVAIVVNYPGC
ncbi:ATP-dependent DNA helicase RecQ-like [Asterias rubens]|uniref:ATP-dependent DNA helicase RecQ-like n=1 Tax=Asterias rubens TaxID=7604 RepID=UPI001455B105|nr:ATP-dependent DNA helicase RecQ-like [Asterias rubens]